MTAMRIRWRARKPSAPKYSRRPCSSAARISGEHGIGVEKLDQMCAQFDRATLDAFTGIKRAFDPGGLLNPGKVVPTLHRCGEFGKQRGGGAGTIRRAAAVLMDAAIEALAENDPRRRSRAHAAAHPRRRQQGFLRQSAQRRSCSIRARSAASSPTNPPSWRWSRAAARTLAEIEALLDRDAQMLAFEPPRFGAGATIGGCIASGLAGPRRASAGYAYGGVRDFVLGARLLDGRAQLLSFGGMVMKNVAGYDAARLLVGSLGVLGVIVEVSLKVVPKASGGNHAAIRHGRELPL